MKGQILIEGVITLLTLALPALFFHLELIRASHYQVFLRQACFYYVRTRALGGSETEARRKIREIGENFFPKSRFARWEQYVDSETWQENDFVFARLKRRYQSWFPLFHDRFQMTKVCKFSL